jgi:hypothetical protein
MTTGAGRDLTAATLDVRGNRCVNESLPGLARAVAEVRDQRGPDSASSARAA